jgi:Na+/H+-dicarboxylate symporter
MLKVTGYVMKFAPFAVFAAVAGTIAKSGLGVLSTYGVFMAEFYFGIALLWALLIFIGFLFLKGRVFALMKEMRSPALLAFSTASSEAAYPKRWKAWSVSACATASPRSCCRSATRSTSMAR